LAPKTEMIGAPMTTPSAYAVMMWPAVDSWVPRSAAMDGSRLIEANSPAPNANVPMASQNVTNPTFGDA